VIIALTRATLRAFRTSDVEALARHANDREIWRHLRDRFPHPYGPADAERFISMVSGAAPVTTFAIEIEGEAAGAIGLEPGYDIERIGAELGYWLGRRWWGHGIASDAVVAVTAYAFDTLGLERVFALPFTHNTASLRVLEKAGYEREGLLRRSALKGGQVVDQYLYAALRPEPPG
jgi:ribosomal-protein-alanine N-acetyltransferase